MNPCMYWNMHGTGEGGSISVMRQQSVSKVESIPVVIGVLCILNKWLCEDQQLVTKKNDKMEDFHSLAKADKS